MKCAQHRHSVVEYMRLCEMVHGCEQGQPQAPRAQLAFTHWHRKHRMILLLCRSLPRLNSSLVLGGCRQCARQLVSVQIWRCPSVCTAVHVAEIFFTSSSVKARLLEDNRVLPNGVGVWVNSSSPWVVSSVGRLAARFVWGGSSAGSLAARLSFFVLAVLRPSWCSMWVSECRQSCGSEIQVATLFGVATASICPWWGRNLVLRPGSSRIVHGVPQ